eukprot:11381318-Alexandrium_andersonii.AAC.1
MYPKGDGVGMLWETSDVRVKLLANMREALAWNTLACNASGSWRRVWQEQHRKFLHASVDWSACPPNM